MNRAAKIGSLLVGAVVLSACMFVGGAVVGRATTTLLPGGPGLPFVSPGTGVGQQPEEATVSFAPFWETWQLVHNEYVDQPIDDVKLMQGAISGMLQALGDRHTSYMPPSYYKVMMQDTSGELEGIGAYVEGYETCLRIVSPFPGSPAEAAGLRPGDVIIQVDDTEVCGMNEFDIISLVRGRAGTAVRLKVVRKDVEDPLDFEVVRAKIIIPSVESKMLDSDIAYVKINDFGEKTTDELREQLTTLLADNPKGLVLDLRGNPGGFRDTAILVASQFIPTGVIMRERYADQHEEVYNAWDGGLATKIPLVVLINEGSASASEIVAGAVQDTQRGTLVGVKSYGKGSVQTVQTLQGDNGGVRVTIARWYTPNDRTIHGVGITPDVIVEMTDADREAERDPQLDKAVELLLAGK